MKTKMRTWSVQREVSMAKLFSQKQHSLVLKRQDTNNNKLSLLHNTLSVRLDKRVPIFFNKPFIK
jgi:hypothetical protein